MLGTIVNTLSIIIGSLIGLFFKGSIPEQFSKTIMHGIGLAVILIAVVTFNVFAIIWMQDEKIREFYRGRDKVV